MNHWGYSRYPPLLLDDIHSRLIPIYLIPVEVKQCPASEVKLNSAQTHGQKRKQWHVGDARWVYCFVTSVNPFLSISLLTVLMWHSQLHFPLFPVLRKRHN